MNAPDVTSQPRRRGPRGRSAYLWLIKRVPDRHQPPPRDAATTVRHRQLRIRLCRERRIRRSRRSLHLATLGTQQRRQGPEHNEDSISQHDQQVAEQLPWPRRGRVARVIFPARVRFPGDDELVVIDATGHPTTQIVACQDHFPQRFLAVTDAPSVGALRTAEIPNTLRIPAKYPQQP